MKSYQSESILKIAIFFIAMNIFFFFKYFYEAKQFIIYVTAMDFSLISKNLLVILTVGKCPISETLYNKPMYSGACIHI